MNVKLNNHVVGNAGLYYACYQLSLRGWNAMPTARTSRIVGKGMEKSLIGFNPGAMTAMIFATNGIDSQQLMRKDKPQRQELNSLLMPTYLP
jgi:hypothetical protein